jgi:hypothetical protein
MAKVLKREDIKEGQIVALAEDNDLGVGIIPQGTKFKVNGFYQNLIVLEPTNKIGKEILKRVRDEETEGLFMFVEPEDQNSEFYTSLCEVK